jgi:1-acyl-sn-glycerol-3-phosphate acyltransferase
MPYRAAVTFVRWTLRIFFRKIEVTGLDNVPEKGGGLVVSWHPNALIDAALILVFFPRKIVFGARHGLFGWPLLGRLMHALGTVPVYRRQDFPDAGGDDAARRNANAKSLDALAAAIASGAYSALFPEGDSHDEPAPTELKTGAARLYYRARELTDASALQPVIIPVGLHYDKKSVFGSSALVAIHPPLELSPALAEPPPSSASTEVKRARYRELTDELEATLHELVHATQSWEQHHALHRARKILRAERAHRAGAQSKRPDMKERVLGFSRLWAGYNTRARTHPDEVAALYARVVDYDADLRQLGIQDHELDGSPRLASPWLAAIVVLQAILVYLLLPPILILGYVANLPAAVAVWLVARSAASQYKDEASLKLITGVIAFPLSWLVAGVLVAWGNRALAVIYPEFPEAPLVSGVLAFFLSAVGAYVALNYQRFARQTLRSLNVRLTRFRRKRTLARLRAERAALYDAFVELGRGLELPGVMASDGRLAE